MQVEIKALGCAFYPYLLSIQQLTSSSMVSRMETVTFSTVSDQTQSIYMSSQMVIDQLCWSFILQEKFNIVKKYIYHILIYLRCIILLYMSLLKTGTEKDKEKQEQKQIEEEISFVIIGDGNQQTNLNMTTIVYESTKISQVAKSLKNITNQDYHILMIESKNIADQNIPVLRCCKGKIVKIKLKEGKQQINFIIIEEGGNQVKLNETITVKSTAKVSQVSQKLKKLTNQQYRVLLEDKKKRADLESPIMDCASKKLKTVYVMLDYSKQSIQIQAFSEKNYQLPVITCRGKMNQLISEFITNNAKLADFDIVDEKDKLISLSAELKNAIFKKDNKNYIKYIQKDTEALRQAKMAKLENRMVKMKQLRKELDEAHKNFKDAGNKSIADKQKDLAALIDYISKDVAYATFRDLKLDEKIKYSSTKESDSFMSRLKEEAKEYTVPKLLEESPNRIYWPYFNETAFEIRKRILDFEKCKINISNVSSYTESQYSSSRQKQVQSIKKSVDKSISEVDVSASLQVKAFCVTASLESHYSQSESNQQQKEDKTAKKTTENHLILYGINKTEAYDIEDEYLALKKDIIEIIRQLYKKFEEGSDQFEKRVNNFFKTYGTHLQVGRYTYGCIYSFISSAQSTEVTTQKILKSASKCVKNIGVSGGIEGGSLQYSAKAGFSYNNLQANENASLSKDLQKTAEVSYQINYDLGGLPIKNRDQWRQMSGIYRKGWKCLQIQDIRKVSLVDIMRNNCNRIFNPSYKKPFDHFLHQIKQATLKIHSYQKEKIEVKTTDYDTKQILYDEMSNKSQEELSNQIYKEIKLMFKTNYIEGQKMLKSRLKTLIQKSENPTDGSKHKIEWTFGDKKLTIIKDIQINKLINLKEFKYLLSKE